MGFIVSKKLRPRPFFHRTLECLLISEGNETGKYILGLCFPMGPADTGRPPREAGGVRSKRADELGRQAASMEAGPQGALLSR